MRSIADAPDAFGETLEHARERSEAEWAATARAASRGNHRVWFVAETADERAVGVVQARRRPPESCLLFSMWVDPSVRRTGVGAQLLDAVESWGRGWGAREVVLWVFESNLPAIRLYERSGFKHVAEGRDSEAAREWGALAMRRRVRASRR